ncbi:hypothetical protein C3B58_03330 [Lactonifactor longoviformis]|uniref:Uncharacterized conserved protein, DUF169 family n=1 Tax=Lactonifactor longoviformis DSM 17459 TaxID=1122155 RepID=A0A1M4VMW7_9CLOT|nr:DUF169 domain-containing protein [Lactonifactor longoviformis]POP34341.1 hypothetical protein C3B58_03330 [Lactonifactor longoviformis]SHE70384.1 Uncharacterized conserved protein, DUF169 family [Lactonifactor longoviformis DSM 17459]
MNAEKAAKLYTYEDGKLPEYFQELIGVLKLRAAPTAIKFFEDLREMRAVKKIRIPAEGEIFTACQMVGQATRLNYTVGFTKEHMPTIQCSGVCGFIPKEDYIHSPHLAGTWFEKPEESARHQESMYHLDKMYEGVAASPAVLGRLNPPDVCLVYGTPQQIMFMCCALQYDDYEVIESSFVGETSCTDSWIRAFVTQKPCFTMPCFGERRFGGVWDDEMVLAFPPAYICKILDGLKKLAGNGLRYPAAQYGIQRDAREGLSVSYDLNAVSKSSK